MKKYECVEVCPDCMGENIFQWNTEVQGFVAYCQHCGAKMMLCDECQHTILVDGEPHDCDWCNDAGGVCHRDTSPVGLETYGHYEEKGDIQYELCFKVPKNWLWNWVKANGYKSISEFLRTYTWDTTMDTYANALKDEVIIETWEEEE